MTQQQIEQAARKYGCDAYIEYCRQHGVDAATAKYPSLENAFITGAEWMLQNMWISVDEELPPIDDGLIAISKDVIVRNEYGKTTTAWYSYSARNWHLCYGEIQGDDLIHSKITHWMEIPTEGGE